MRYRSKSIKILFFVIPVFFVGVLGLVVYNFFDQKSNANAVSAADFNAGNIIDDSVFYNKNAMTADQIQAFLNNLMPNCYPYGQSAVSGFTPPYVCLKDYHENITTGETSFEKGGGAFSGGTSAAQIIYNAAQEYGINPQVLLVLLKKESLGPLTSDTWPVKSQYKFAMGYACPDSGPDNTANCDSSKSGFYKQIRAAAWQLKYYKDHPNDYRYRIGWNDIQYSPNTACGTKRVNIENIATLSLYIYTPYTPNDAALANYPGTVNCGAYGNRNFFMFFSEWFGSTRGDVFTPKPSSISIADGVYFISASNNRTLDVSGASKTNGTKVVSYPLNGNLNQKWEVKRLKNGYYTFKDMNSGRFLDIFNGATYNGADVGIWDESNGENQQFAIHANAGGNGYYIQAKVSGKVIDIANNSLSANTKIQTWAAGTGISHAWNFWPTISIEQGEYTIVNPISNKALDISNGQINTNGTNVQIYSANSSASQSWYLRNNGNGTYSILNSVSRKSLDIKGGNIYTNDQQVQLWNDSANGSQVWNIAAANNGYTFINPYSRKVLESSGGQINLDGNLIKTYSQNGTNAQNWVLIKK